MALHDCYQSCLHCLGFLSGAMTFPTLTKLDHFHSWVKTGPYTHVTKTYVWEGLAACRPKANKQARLVERKVCFISDASNCWGRVVDTCPKADPHSTLATSGARAFIERSRGSATCRNSTVSSDSHPQIGHQCSEQRHLGCFRYS